MRQQVLDAWLVTGNFVAMFEAVPNAKADLKPGTLYSLVGAGSWLYYAQIAADKSVGFFRRRDRELASVTEVLSSPIMFRVTVEYPSIGRALRAGRWTKLGRYDLAETLNNSLKCVQWPVGTLSVTVWDADVATYETQIDDPKIQHLEIMAVWDAELHIPERLASEFGAEDAALHVGGPVFKERKIKEEMAQRFPDQPGHRLPRDWVWTVDS